MIALQARANRFATRKGFVTMRARALVCLLLFGGLAGENTYLSCLTCLCRGFRVLISRGFRAARMPKPAHTRFQWHLRLSRAENPALFLTRRGTAYEEVLGLCPPSPARTTEAVAFLVVAAANVSRARCGGSHRRGARLLSLFPPRRRRLGPLSLLLPPAFSSLLPHLPPASARAAMDEL